MDSSDGDQVHSDVKPAATVMAVAVEQKWL
jgi:hypothetical protein